MLVVDVISVDTYPFHKCLKLHSAKIFVTNFFFYGFTELPPPTTTQLPPTRSAKCDESFLLMLPYTQHPYEYFFILKKELGPDVTLLSYN